jgi:citrate synthase
VARETLTLVDNRTGKTYEVPITHGTIRAADLRQIKVDDDDFGLMSYDPGFKNTAACESRITYIDGDRGVLLYRGFPIEQLAENASFLETAYLLLDGELPAQAQLAEWTYNITVHTMLHENVKKFMEGFRYDAHPMGILVGTIGALSTFYPDAKEINDLESRILKMPSGKRLDAMKLRLFRRIFQTSKIGADSIFPARLRFITERCEQQKNQHSRMLNSRIPRSYYCVTTTSQ